MKYRTDSIIFNKYPEETHGLDGSVQMTFDIVLSESILPYLDLLDISKRMSHENFSVLNEHLRRKRTEYHFAPLARFAALFRSTAPLTLYWTDAAELRGINPQRLNSCNVFSNIFSSKNRHAIRKEIARGKFAVA